MGAVRTTSTVWTEGEIFQLIRLGRASSRAEISVITGLSPTSVTTRVERLAEAKLITQGRNSTRGGRNPRRIEINPDIGVVAAVDLGSRHVRVGLVDAAGQLRFECTRSVVPMEDLGSVLRIVADDVRKSLSELAQLSPESATLLGIGLSIPAPVDLLTKRLVHPTRIPSWHDRDLIGFLSQEFNVPVAVDNDAALMALAEHRMFHPNVQDLLFVKVGSGIGCGIIANGDVYRGVSGGAGAVGHVSVDVPFARQCLCGRSDCLEASVGGQALVSILREANYDIDQASDIADLVNANDRFALDLVRTAGRAIGDALATVSNFYNPEFIVLGGSLSTIDQLTNSLRSTLYDRVLALSARKLSIVESKNGVNASIFGAACLVLDTVLGLEAVNDLVETTQSP